MRAPISVIIPTLNAGQTLAATLGALGDGLEMSLIREVIVTDGGSTDETARIADEAGATLIAGAPGRGGQLRRGAQVALAPWLLVLHADTRLDRGWSEVVLDHIQKRPGKAGYFRLAFDVGGMPSRLVAGWANFRARAFGLPFGDQGLLVPRDVYHAVGGYADIPIMEDVALARALRGQLGALDATAYTSADKYTREGWLRRGGRNWMLLARYFMGADPVDLARAYRQGQ